MEAHYQIRFLIKLYKNGKSALLTGKLLSHRASFLPQQQTESPLIEKQWIAMLFERRILHGIDLLSRPSDGESTKPQENLYLHIQIQRQSRQFLIMTSGMHATELASSTKEHIHAIQKSKTASSRQHSQFIFKHNMIQIPSLRNPIHKGLSTSKVSNIQANRFPCCPQLYHP